ncbi:MAG: GNAT family N-acetyltransferase [Anaerolineales bacterium]
MSFIYNRIENLEAFAALAEEWNALLQHSVSRVPFLRHEYLFAWWRTLGGGEWQDGLLSIYTARDAQGALRGIAPLFETTLRTGERVRMFLGSIEISDYLDWIARPEDLPEFLEGLLAHWDANGDQGSSALPLDLYNLLEDSPSLAALAAAAETRGWHYTQSTLQPAPYIPLPGDWEAYLNRIDKKQRHEIRRKIRRLESNEAVVSRWYIVNEESALDVEIDAFLALMAQDSAKQSFLTDAMRTQMHAAVHAAFRSGWLQLAFLEINGEKAAGYLNFDFDNQVWVYNSGLNFELGAYSPGWVLLGYLLQWANENGRTAFDFMRGDEQYKYRFGAENRFVVRVQVIPE